MSNVFVSFDHDDQQQVGGFRLLNSSSRHPLDFRDHSLHDPVTNRGGQVLRYAPGDPRSEPVRREINRKFQNASKLVVLIGPATYQSEWVDWEIRSFFDLKYGLSGDKTWRRIRGMRLKNCDGAPLPAALGNRSTMAMNWDPVGLSTWLDADPDA